LPDGLRLCELEPCRGECSPLPRSGLFFALEILDNFEQEGGPLKPGFGLSGAVLPLDKVFPQLVRVFAPSIPAQSLPVPHSQLRVPHTFAFFANVWALWSDGTLADHDNSSVVTRYVPIDMR